MTDNENSNSASNQSGDDYMGQNQGEQADGEETEETNTADDVAENNPEDNKKLAEVTMMEQLRETFNLTLKFPKILRCLHTNQFFWIDVPDDFYETNYPTLISVIADTKFARMAGFEKGRFFIEKIEEKGGNDGWETTLTLNPIPPSLALWSQKQKEAQKALMQAVHWETGAGGGGTGGSVNATELVAIGNELAGMYTFCGEADCKECTQSYTEMKRTKCGSCFAWSGALYTELTAKGYQVRVIQYDSGVASNHRSVQINQNGNWEDYPYRSTNIPRNARSTESKPGCFVIDESTLQSIL